MKNKLLILCLVMCLLFTLVAGTALAARSVSFGDVKFSLADDGTLTVSGSGPVPYAEIWGKYISRSSVKAVIIEDGITDIGTFEGCKNLTRVTLPNSIDAIGAFAFSDCTGLSSIDIPENVTIIASEAFRGCSSLTNITIPDNVRTIERWAFGDCTGLTSVTISKSVIEIEEGAFNGCSNLTSVSISDELLEIGNWVFNRCPNLCDVYYDGTESDWEKIIILEENDDLMNATIHYNMRVVKKSIAVTITVVSLATQIIF